MRIAVLGFGSLINHQYSDIYKTTLEVARDPDAAYCPSLNRGRETPFVPAEGLMLPICLGYHSSAHTPHRRFTMVVDAGAEKAQVYYALSKMPTLEEAIANLARREGLPPTSTLIGFVDLNEGHYQGRLAEVADDIVLWARGKFDAVIWTDLRSNLAANTDIRQSLAHDKVLLENTKNYIQDLPNPPNELQQEILNMQATE